MSEQEFQKAPHYNSSDYEVIDVLQAWGLHEDAYLWNVVKYIARHKHKGRPLADLKKALYYLNKKVNELEKES